jgi:hypothetical protein
LPDRGENEPACRPKEKAPQSFPAGPPVLQPLFPRTPSPNWRANCERFFA